MKVFNTIQILFSLFNSRDNYNRVITSQNKIKCYGPITPILADKLIESLEKVQEDGLKYTSDTTRGYIPIYLTLNQNMVILNQ